MRTPTSRQGLWILVVAQACFAEQPAPRTPPEQPEGRGPKLIAIPGGTFWMGVQHDPSKGVDKSFYEDEPWHEVRVRAFEIDATEVTVGQYERCVRAGHCTSAKAPPALEIGPEDFRNFWSQFCNTGRPGRDEHPVNCVDWYQADAFCGWAGKRLPTEQEWEYAARGTDGRKYPWGNEAPGPLLVNGCDAACLALGRSRGVEWRWHFDWTDGHAATAPVGSFPHGRSPFGLLDMAGNVEEWTASSYAASEDGSPDRRVVRGRRWSSDRMFEVALRSGYPPARETSVLGFRCARDAR